MHTEAIFIACLSLVSWVIQLLPVISVPITGALINYGLSFCTWGNYTYGVFGVCDSWRHVCSSPAIGYPNTDLFYYDSLGLQVAGEELSEVELPSDATHLISKLLVVHLVAFCFTSALMIDSILLMTVLYLRKKRPGWLLRSVWAKKDPANTPRKKDITPYLSWMLFFGLFSFLLTLLAFLADILMFIPRLSFLGWIQLLPILLMALIALLVCFMKRSISSRRHLDDEPYFSAGLRGKNTAGPRWADDSASDDGFYVYTNGFISANHERDGESPELRVLQSGRLASRHSHDLGDVELRDIRSG